MPSERARHTAFLHRARMKKLQIGYVLVCVSYMDEVFISSTDDVVVSDGDGVDAASTGLQDVNTVQRTDVPDLTDRHEDRK